MIDFEALLTTWAEANLDNLRAVSETPANMDALVPLLKVRVIGGSYDGFRLSRATVDADAFAATRDEATAVALQVLWGFTSALARNKVGDVVVTRVETLTYPRPLPYDNTGLRRVGATYRITGHTA